MELKRHFDQNKIFIFDDVRCDIESENILYKLLTFMSTISIIQYYDCLDDNPGNVSNTQYYILVLVVMYEII